MKSMDHRKNSVVMELTHDEIETISSVMMTAQYHFDKKAWSDMKKRTNRTEKDVAETFEAFLKVFPLAGD